MNGGNKYIDNQMCDLSQVTTDKMRQQTDGQRQTNTQNLAKKILKYTVNLCNMDTLGPTDYQGVLIFQVSLCTKGVLWECVDPHFKCPH